MAYFFEAIKYRRVTMRTRSLVNKLLWTSSAWHLFFISTIAFSEDYVLPPELAEKFTESGALEYASEISVSRAGLPADEERHIISYISSAKLSDEHFVNLIYLLGVGIENVKDRSIAVISHSERLEDILRNEKNDEIWARCIFCLAQAFEAPDDRGVDLEERICRKIGQLNPSRQDIAVTVIGIIPWADSEKRKTFLKALYANESITPGARDAILESCSIAAMQKWILKSECAVFFAELAELPQHTPILTKRMFGHLGMFLLIQDTKGE